jgi:HK97 gp10 family phage protein
MQWSGESYVREVERTTGQRVQAAGIYLQGKVREIISIPSRTVSFRDNKAGKRVKVLGARGSNRSKPGMPPHKDYGRLRQSIATDFDPATTTARVGTNLAYGKFLELGTSKMRPRPYLRRTLAEEKNEIERMILGQQRTDITVKD